MRKQKWRLKRSLQHVGIAFLFIGFITPSYAQDGHHYKYPIKLMYGNHSVGTGENGFDNFNPNVVLETELQYNKSKRHKIGQTAGVGFSKNTVIGNKVYLKTATFYRYTHKIGAFVDIGIDLGMNQQFHPRDVYVYDEESGKYEAKNDYGITTVMGGFEIGLGYDFSEKEILPVSVFLRFNNYVQAPYLDLDVFPVMFQTVTQIGVNFKIKKNEK